VGVTRVVIHVGSLRLAGFAAGSGQAIADGLRAELGRLLAAPGAAERWATAGDLARLRVDGGRIGHGDRPQRVGARLGRRIDAGIGR
jgi:hypothetical protein